MIVHLLTSCSITLSALVFLLLSLAPSPLQAGSLRIVYGNDNLGELAPCGSCDPLYRRGGMAKKATFLKSLDGDMPLLLLDAGNLLFQTPALANAPAGAEKARTVARGVMDANRRLGFRIAAVGMHDLSAGPAFLREAAGEDFTWLSANLRDQRSGALLFPAFTTVQVDTLTVGVVGLTGQIEEAQASRWGYSVAPWQQVLPQLVAEIRPWVHILVLLSNNPLLENRKIAESCPGVDLIFQSGFARGNLPPLAAGSALINQTEIRGRYLGLLEIDWQGPGSWHQRPVKTPFQGSSYTQKFINLNFDVQDDRSMTKMVDDIEKCIEPASSEIPH